LAVRIGCHAFFAVCFRDADRFHRAAPDFPTSVLQGGGQLRQGRLGCCSHADQRLGGGHAGFRTRILEQVLDSDPHQRLRHRGADRRLLQVFLVNGSHPPQCLDSGLTNLLIRILKQPDQDQQGVFGPMLRTQKPFGHPQADLGVPTSQHRLPLLGRVDGHHTRAGLRRFHRPGLRLQRGPVSYCFWLTAAADDDKGDSQEYGEWFHVQVSPPFAGTST
jgi:hypothetical protein